MGILEEIKAQNEEILALLKGGATAAPAGEKAETAADGGVVAGDAIAAKVAATRAVRAPKASRAAAQFDSKVN